MPAARGRFGKAGLTGLAIVTVFAAGCASRGSGASNSASSGTGKAGVTDITFTQATPTLLWAPVYLAQDKGLFKKNGLNVKVVISGGASTAMEAVLSGSAQIASGGLSDNIELASHGKPLQAFATMATGDPDDIVVTKKFAASKHLTTSSPLAAKVKALKGATIGIAPAAALPQQLLGWMLRRYGLSLSDVTIVPQSTPATALASMAHGRIDAILYPPPAPQGAMANGSAIMWIDASQGEIKPPYWTGALATSSYIASHPQAVRAFARSINDALQYMAEHKAAAGQAIQHNFSSMSTSDYNATWDSLAPVFARTVAVSPGQYTSVVSFLKGVGVSVPASVAFGDVATTAVASKVVGPEGS